MLKTCIFIKAKLIQKYFSRIFLLPEIPYSFLKIEQTPFWRKTSWWQQLYVVGLSMLEQHCFWNEKKHSPT